MTYKEEKRLIGNRDQLFRINRIERKDGKAAGVEMIDVSNRSGMHFDVNISRGLDIPYLDFNGENVGFLAPCGIVHPSYFDDKELGFLKSFAPGFLTTCGLKIVGVPCEFEGQSYGLHGNISNTPAENFRYSLVEDENPYVLIEGDVNDGIIFGERLTLHRTIKCYYRERKIYLHDRVTNDGARRTRHMILYHCNIGYPLLSPDSEIYIPSDEVIPRNEHSQSGIKRWINLEDPDPKYEEMCYYHKLKKNGNGRARVGVFNVLLDFGVSIDFDAFTLDHFIQWKMMGVNDYVTGLEPANATIDGVADAVSNGSMKYLEPDESVEYDLVFSILKGKREFESIKY
ncbi:aldose 1-epimerase family protein [Treponema parvum]|uniref:Aldose 1-epimerase family protein n=1 Tax=Treponema parvum TaxID=138851 RepID=A0A975IBC8_9SPIR|nr:aldose 1-epimerase family protein [Treponema parvum]QTQ10755.1 aldose 1-epimerase family protein [Treponema parvum]QTQ17282.1 aldose 1-epimerase family protein [Treponema parvum]